MSNTPTLASVDVTELSGAGQKAFNIGLLASMKTAGMQEGSRTTITADTALTVSQCGLVLVDCSSGNVALDLPASGTTTNDAVYLIRRLDSTSNTLTVERSGADTVEGAATALSVGAQGILGLQLPSGGTDWKVHSRSGGTVAGARLALGLGAGANVASAASLDLSGIDGDIVRVTGNDATSEIIVDPGRCFKCIADEQWPLTYHATDVPLPGGMDYTCEAGDMVTIMADLSGAITILIDKKNGNGINEIGELFFTVGDTAPGGALVTNGQAVSRTVYANLNRVMNGAFSAQTFTVTIASPGVFTKTSHGFTGGERIRLSTTGALPTGLDSSTDYFVLYVSANTFRLATTYEGTAINTSGSQSGTHSYLQSVAGLGDGSTTFNLPDTRDEFPRSLGTGRTRGTRRLDAIQGHGHDLYVGNTSEAFAHGNLNAQIALADSGGGRSLKSSAGGAQDIINTPLTLSGYGAPRIGTETQPRHQAWLGCIKY